MGRKRDLDITYIVDSREQRPYFVDNSNLQVKVRKLVHADYSIQGLERLVSVERKNKSDLIQSLTRSRKRFEAELLSLRAYRYKCVVCECSYDEIAKGMYQNDVSPKALVGSIARWQTEGVTFQFCGNRDNAENFTKMFLDFVARNIAQYAQAYAPSLAVAQARGGVDAN